MEKVNIKLDRVIRIERPSLPDSVVNTLKERLIFENPLYLRNAKYGRPTRNIKPYLFCIWHDKERDDLIISRGFLSGLVRILNGSRVGFELSDLTRKVQDVDFDFRGSLYGYQEEALKEVAKKRFGVLVGPVGCGKKVLSLKLVALRKVLALVIVRTKRQMYQWKEIAGRFLGLDDLDVGLIGDQHRNLGRKITIAISLSLYKVMDQVKPQTGFVIVDQCDMANLKIFFKGVMPLDCPYMLGLAAVPKRSDGLTALMRAYLGPVVYRIRLAKDFVGLGQGRPILKIRRTNFNFEYMENWSEMITALCQDQARNALIVADVLQETANPGAKAVVISERVSHLESLLEDTRGSYGDGEIITGDTLDGKRSEIFGRFDRGKLNMILTTHKSLSNLEVKRANRLFVASPLKYGDHLAQIVGKLLGTGQGEQRAKIFDYRDEPELLEVSLKKRLKVYRSMGVVDG